ncbi:MAG: bifunctional UDP-N-acetylglucosamine diphosphorylase/glucosamine-1-phosphate N-acetyltransferase GlmU [Gaiellaceae bacterium]
MTQIAAVIMAAGLGTRMKSSVPKHLHPLLGRRLVDWVIEAAREVGPDPLVVVASPEHRDAYAGVEVAVQERPLGTGDAVRAARAAVDGAPELLVLSGDHPLVSGSALEQLIAAHRQSGAAATVLSFEPTDPRSYGRILRDGDGRLRSIVEAADASPEELEVAEVNASIYVFDAERLWPALERLEPHNAQGELYLTDAVRGLVEAGEEVAVHRAADAAEIEGVNTRAELAAAAAVLRDRINERHMLAGVTIVDPATTWIDPSVELAADAVIEPFTVLRGTTRVAAGAQIGPHAVAVDAVIGPGALVGPFCYLRPGTVLEDGAKAGTFVELKQAHIGKGAKVPHLSYFGDAEVGEGTNVGAGTITANLGHKPGAGKQRTKVGRNVKLGIQNSLVAPVEIGDGSWTAPHSAITEDVPPDSLAGFPPRQETKEGYVREDRDD